ncbi:AAA family ATPase [Mycobacteroides abscessus]|uniref:AAA family ATPase n=1 Tax=Mycobacteroides abscessus TaxID=36809 RepID=UPI001F430AEE|nr:AAA family ATPase [Mycobacteroides abscessus]
MQRDKRPHDYYTHPELRGIPYMELKRIYREQEAAYEKNQREAEAKPADGSGTDSDRPKVWSAGDLEPAKPKHWLAKNRIPRSGVTVLVGEEGIGKSLFWVWIVAAVTTGKPLPEFGIPARDPQHVRLIITEDDWSTEVLPRLELADADLDYVSVICANRDGSGSPTFPDDIDLLYVDPAPALVVVDAWLDTVPAKLNIQTPQHARLALHPWKEVATQAGAAVVLMTHTNRAKGPARDKYGITGELRKKARMALYAQTNEKKQFVIGPEKANGSAIIAASAFDIEVVQVHASTDDDDGTVARLKYVGQSDQTAREMANSDGASPEQMWLINHLAEGPQKNVVETAVEEGFKAYKIRLAAKELKVKFDRVGYPAVSEWSLP